MTHLQLGLIRSLKKAAEQQLLPPGGVKADRQKYYLKRRGQGSKLFAKGIFLSILFDESLKNNYINEVQDDVNVYTSKRHTTKNVVAFSNEHYQGHPRHRVSLRFCFVFSYLCSHVYEPRSVQRTLFAIFYWRMAAN